MGLPNVVRVIFRILLANRAALILVQPDTVVRWHRRGFRLYWTWRSRRTGRGRPAVSLPVRELIRKMSRANPCWGAPRIHGELQKLGIDISQATVRRVVHFNVTDSPTAKWTAQQIVEAFPWDTAPRYLLRDRDGIYGHEFVGRVRSMGIREVMIAARSPWQSPYVERLIGTLRRDCLDHVIVLTENRGDPNGRRTPSSIHATGRLTSRRRAGRTTRDRQSCAHARLMRGVLRYLTPAAPDELAAAVPSIWPDGLYGRDRVAPPATLTHL